MADAGVLSPTEFAKRMLNKDERKESIQNIKENIKGSLNEIRHGVKDTVKVVNNLQVIMTQRFIFIKNTNNLLSLLDFNSTSNCFSAFARWTSWTSRCSC